ncbi:MAG: hypothetical protein ACJAWS_002945 [Oleiphilaceae bacterium]|jgi:hypothetical protein
MTPRRYRPIECERDGLNIPQQHKHQAHKTRDQQFNTDQINLVNSLYLTVVIENRTRLRKY